MKSILSSLLVVAAAAACPTAHAGPFAVGDVFASTGGGQVNVFSSTGTFKATLDTGLGGFTTGSAFDKFGNFYVTAFSNNTVAKFDPNGVLLNSAWTTGLGANESIVFDKSGNAYIGNAGAAKVLKVDSNGTALQTFNVQSNTDWIDLAADQKTLIYSDESNTIRQWDVSSDTALADFATGSGPLYAKRIRPNGDVMVASGNGSVYRYNAAGVLAQTYNLGIGSVFALNLDPNGTSFWTGTTGGQTLQQIDIASGNILNSWNTGVGQLYGVAVLGEIAVGGVPEPSTYAMMFMGMFALVLVARSRRNG